MKKELTHWTVSFLKSDPFLDFLNLIPDAVILSTTSGKIIRTNQIAQTLFQYTETEFLNYCIEDLVPEQFKKEHPKLRKAFFKHPAPRHIGENKKPLVAQKKTAPNSRWHPLYLPYKQKTVPLQST